MQNISNRRNDKLSKQSINLFDTKSDVEFLRTIRINNMLALFERKICKLVFFGTVVKYYLAKSLYTDLEYSYIRKL